MAIQVGSGAAGLGVGGLAGVLIGLAVSDSHNFGQQLGAVAVGGAIGGVIGIVAGVDLGGNLRNSTGHWWGAAVGLVGGLFLAGGLAKASDRLHPPPILEVVLGSLCIFGGTIAGYQLTADAHPPVMPIANLTF